MISIERLNEDTLMMQISDTPPVSGKYLDLNVSRDRCDWMKRQPDTAVQPQGFVGKESSTMTGVVTRYRRTLEPTAIFFDISASAQGVMVQGHSGPMDEEAVSNLIACLEQAKRDMQRLKS